MITMTVCPAPSASQDFNNDYGTDDFVLQCHLIQRTVTIKAHSITVDGANGGNITTSGIGGTQLNARVTTNSNKQCVAPADGTANITIHNALIEDQNSNGGITMRSCGNQVVDSTSQIHSAGAAITQTCYFGLNGEAPPCTISIDSSNYYGNRIIVTSEGDLTLGNSTFQTIGPRDQQTFISLLGSIIGGSNCALPACIPPQDACLVCQGCHGKNTFFGGVESNFFAYAMQFIDFNNDCINIAENITMAALDTDPLGACNNALAPPPAGVLNVTGAEIRNDFGKTGNIMFSAHPAWKSCSTPLPNGRPLNPDEIPFLSLPGDGSINIDNAVIVDTGSCNGGGICQSKVANMNGGQDTVNGACGAVSLNCNLQPIDPTDNPVHADPVARGAHFVINATTVRCDS